MPQIETIILTVLVISFIIYFYVYSPKNWVEVYSGDQSRLDEAQLKYSQLKDHGINCKMSIKSGYGKVAQDNTASILVKKKDEEKAREILSKD